MKTNERAGVMLHALLSLPTDGSEWLASQTATSIQEENISYNSSIMGFDNMSLESHSEPIAPSNRLKASPPALPQCGSDVIEPPPFSLFPYMGIDW